MKLETVAEAVKEYIKPSEFDKRGTEMTYPNVYDKKNLGIGLKTKVTPKTVIMRNTATGAIYGRRTIMSK